MEKNQVLLQAVYLLTLVNFLACGKQEISVRDDQLVSQDASGKATVGEPTTEPTAAPTGNPSPGTGLALGSLPQYEQFKTMVVQTVDALVQQWLLRPSANITPVSITSVGTVATVSAPNHGLPEGEPIFVYGANQSEYNGYKLVSNVTPNSFQYQMTAVPSAAVATGTLKYAPYVDNYAADGSSGSIYYGGYHNLMKFIEWGESNAVANLASYRAARIHPLNGELNRFRLPYANQGYRRFPQVYGLALLNGEAGVYIDDIRRVRDTGPFSATSGFFHSDPTSAYHGRYTNVSREAAYLLATHLWSEKVGEARLAASLTQLIEYAANHLYRWRNEIYDNPNSPDTGAPFMIALTLQSLIQFYDWEVANNRDPNALWPAQVMAAYGSSPQFTANPWNSMLAAIHDILVWQMAFAGTVDTLPSPRHAAYFRQLESGNGTGIGHPMWNRDGAGSYLHMLGRTGGPEAGSSYLTLSGMAVGPYYWLANKLKYTNTNLALQMAAIGDDLIRTIAANPASTAKERNQRLWYLFDALNYREEAKKP